MLLAEMNVDIPRAAIAGATEHRARWASGCHPPSVESRNGSIFTLLLASWTIAAYLENFPALAAFKKFNGFCKASRNSCLPKCVANSKVKQIRSLRSTNCANIWSLPVPSQRRFLNYWMSCSFRNTPCQNPDLLILSSYSVRASFTTKQMVSINIPYTRTLRPCTHCSVFDGRYLAKVLQPLDALPLHANDNS